MLVSFLSAAFVAYLRVSTQRQQRSGLGIEAQRATIARFAETEGFSIIAEYIEAETGKGSDALDRRPQCGTWADSRMPIDLLCYAIAASERGESDF